MTELELTTWKKLATDRLDRFTNKAERTAFLIGLSLGARETNNEEKQRVCSDLKSLYGIDLDDQVQSGSNRTGRVRRAAVGQLDDSLTEQLAQFLES